MLIDEVNPVLAGFTDSYETGYHLQSYALAANSALLTDVGWLLFWSTLVTDLTKDKLVAAGEVGLSLALHSIGVSLRAVYPLIGRLICNPLFTDELQRYPNLTIGLLNPSRLLSQTLKSEGFTFVKKQALFELPAGLTMMHDCVLASEASCRDLLAADLDRLIAARTFPEKLNEN
jgi:hypothetical protein